MSMRRLSLAAALAVYLVMLVFPFAVSTLLAPASGVAFLIAGWAVGLAVLLPLLRRRSLWALAMPLLALAFWAATVTVGEAFLGWSA